MIHFQLNLPLRIEAYLRCSIPARDTHHGTAGPNIAHDS